MLVYPHGKVAEWLKALVSKTSKGASFSRVRIPPFPPRLPSLNQIKKYMKYQQKHPETCLAKCLMILLEKKIGKKIKDRYELDLLNYSFKHERENITRGHIEKVAKDFRVSFDWCVDSKIFFDFIKEKSLFKRIKLINKKINKKLINSILDSSLIVYLDRFFLWEPKHGLYYRYHYPHFVIINRKINNGYEIIDPDDGKIKHINKKVLLKAIYSLRNHFLISPHLIKVSD